MLSTLHEHSFLAVKSDLELFSLPPTDFSYDSWETQEFHPSATKPTETDTIEFNIPNTGHYYTDPASMFLFFKARILNGDGSEITAPAAGADGHAEGSELVKPINNFANSMFLSVDVTLNQTLISRHEHYTYRSYVDLLMRSNAEMTHTLWPLMYDADGHGTVVAKEARFERTKLSKVFDCMTPLFTDLCQQSKLLLSGVDMRISLRPNPDAFRLFTKTTKKFKLDIQKMSLHVRRVNVAPNIVVSHERALAKTPATYTLRGMETKIKSLTKGDKDVHFENIAPERLPAKLTFLFVRTDAFYGDFKLEPLDFVNLGITHTTLTVGTEEKTMEYDFDNDNYAMAYTELIRQIGNTHFTIPAKSYKAGHFMIHYNLTPDTQNDSLMPVRKENVRFKAQFKTPLTQNYSCIILTETPRILQIDQDRTVTVE